LLYHLSQVLRTAAAVFAGESVKLSMLPVWVE